MDAEWFLADRRHCLSEFSGASDITDPTSAESFKEGFREGFISALSAFGIWKDGKQRIGCQEIEVQEIVKLIRSIK